MQVPDAAAAAMSLHASAPRATNEWANTGNDLVHAAPCHTSSCAGSSCQAHTCKPLSHCSTLRFSCASCARARLRGFCITPSHAVSREPDVMCVARRASPTFILSRCGPPLGIAHNRGCHRLSPTPLACSVRSWPRTTLLTPLPVFAAALAVRLLGTPAQLSTAPGSAV
jgi:hypothetical protein